MEIGRGGNSMRSPLARIAKRSVRAGGNIVSQVVVSVAAAVCVGFITNAYLEDRPAVEAPVPAAEQAAAATTDAAPEPIAVSANDDAARGEEAARLPRPAPQSQIRDVADAPLPPVATPVETSGAALPPLPSQIVADLPVHDATPHSAEIFPGVPSEGALMELLREPTTEANPESKRRRFLGLPLPYFVPTAGDIFQSRARPATGSWQSSSVKHQTKRAARPPFFT